MSNLRQEKATLYHGLFHGPWESRTGRRWCPGHMAAWRAMLWAVSSRLFRAGSALRVLNPCIELTILQDVSLHYNNTFPFSVLPILDSYFLSDSDDFVTLKLLHSANGPSHTMRKYFSKPQIERMLEMFHRAKRLGQDHAEQFFKDVAATRKAQAEDVERWEQWEAKGGLLKVNARPKPRSNPSTRQSSDSTVHSTRPERAPQTSGLSRLAQEQVASPQALPGNTDFEPFVSYFCCMLIWS